MKLVQQKKMIMTNIKANFIRIKKKLKIRTNSMMITVQVVELNQCPVLPGI